MLRSFATLAIIGLGVAGSAAFAADDSAKQPESAAQQSAPAASGSPTATAESAPKGTLKSPYPDFAKVADEGHENSWPRAAMVVMAGVAVVAWVRL